jgi:hypothetical protein
MSLVNGEGKRTGNGAILAVRREAVEQERRRGTAGGSRLKKRIDGYPRRDPSPDRRIRKTPAAIFAALLAPPT